MGRDLLVVSGYSSQKSAIHIVNVVSLDSIMLILGQECAKDISYLKDSIEH